MSEDTQPARRACPTCGTGMRLCGSGRYICLACHHARAAVNLSVIDRIRAVAREHGWAIGAHGSLVRDIDLIAVPWTAEAVPWRDLYAALVERVPLDDTEGARLDCPARGPFGRIKVLALQPGAVSEQERLNRGEITGPIHPKGRWNPPAIDLSLVDPRDATPAPQPSEVEQLRAELVEARAGRSLDLVVHVTTDDNPVGEMLTVREILARTQEVIAQRDRAEAALKEAKRLARVLVSCADMAIEDRLSACVLPQSALVEGFRAFLAEPATTPAAHVTDAVFERAFQESRGAAPIMTPEQVGDLLKQADAPPQPKGA